MTSNPDDKDNKIEMLEESIVQDKIITDELKDKTSEKIDIVNKDDESKEIDVSAEKNKAVDSDKSN